MTVVAALRALMPADVALAGGAIGAGTATEFTEEAATLQRAIDKRRREFVAGRGYARAALATLGQAPVAIPVLPSRAPQWPPGFVGSISHSHDLCVAAVATRARYAGLGIDVEASTPLLPELHASVLVPAERDAAAAGGDADPAKLRFVIKEAFFKLYHPLAGCYLDFLDAQVNLDPAQRGFELALRDGVPPLRGRRRFPGRCGSDDGFCFAFVALAAA